MRHGREERTTCALRVNPVLPCRLSQSPRPAAAPPPRSTALSWSLSAKGDYFIGLAFDRCTKLFSLGGPPEACKFSL